MRLSDEELLWMSFIISERAAFSFVKRTACLLRLNSETSTTHLNFWFSLSVVQNKLQRIKRTKSELLMLHLLHQRFMLS